MFGPGGDGETAEIRQLRERVGLSDYLMRASVGLGLDGAAAELNAALGVPLMGRSGSVLVPWAALDLRPSEARAFTDTGDLDGPQMQRPILQRLFGPGYPGRARCPRWMRSRPAGAEWPLITGRRRARRMKDGGKRRRTRPWRRHSATETLKPKRLTGRYEFTHEMAAEVPGIEMALRRDLADAVQAREDART